MPAQIIGDNLIGLHESRQGVSTFTSFDPKRSLPGEIRFTEATIAEVGQAAALAARAFQAWRSSPPRQRIALLRGAAQQLEALREPIVDTADAESGLGP